MKKFSLALSLFALLMSIVALLFSLKSNAGEPTECEKGDKECLQMERESNMRIMLKGVCDLYNTVEFEYTKGKGLSAKKAYLGGELEPADQYEYNRLLSSMLRHQDQLKDLKARYEKRFKDEVTKEKCEEISP